MRLSFSLLKSHSTAIWFNQAKQSLPLTAQDNLVGQDKKRGKSRQQLGIASLKVCGKSFCRIKERMDDVLVVMVLIELKQILIEAESDKYFETAHYVGYPAMLVRLANVTDEELQQRLETAWLEKAPKKLAATWMAAHGDGC
jgi:hypothetical protein